MRFRHSCRLAHRRHPSRPVRSQHLQHLRRRVFRHQRPRRHPPRPQRLDSLVTHRLRRTRRSLPDPAHRSHRRRPRCPVSPARNRIDRRPSPPAINGPRAPLPSRAGHPFEFPADRTYSAISRKAAAFRLVTPTRRRFIGFSHDRSGCRRTPRNSEKMPRDGSYSRDRFTSCDRIYRSVVGGIEMKRRINAS